MPRGTDFLIARDDLFEVEGIAEVYDLVEFCNGSAVSPQFESLEKLHAYADAQGLEKVPPADHQTIMGIEQPYVDFDIYKKLVVA